MLREAVAESFRTLANTPPFSLFGAPVRAAASATEAAGRATEDAKLAIIQGGSSAASGFTSSFGSALGSEFGKVIAWGAVILFVGFLAVQLIKAAAAKVVA